jgi:hypothetical protein
VDGCYPLPGETIPSGALAEEGGGVQVVRGWAGCLKLDGAGFHRTDLLGGAVLAAQWRRARDCTDGPTESLVAWLSLVKSSAQV